MGKKRKAVEKKGKIKRGKKKTSAVWKNYEKGRKKNPTCPKCGPAVFMAVHKNRVTCGKCGYTEIK